MKIIKTEEKITSYAFYKKIVPEVLEKLEYIEEGEDCIVDLSATKSVDAMAVPLLLNMARWIIEKAKVVPQLYIPNLKHYDNLKRYLEKVGFFNICDFYNYYEVNTERIPVKRDTANLVTYVFTENAKDNSQKERERIEEYVCRKLTDNTYLLFWKYWAEYDISQNPNSFANGVERVTRSICANTGIHTKENAILTLQRNIELKRVCISLADCGQGLFSTLKKKIKDEGFHPALISPDEFEKLCGEKADLYAIAEALSYRFMDKKYGLYHVMMKNLELEKKRTPKIRPEEERRDNKWAMRIHTNQKRMVFTGKNCKGLEKAATREQFARRILMLAENKYVAETTPNYPGVHIEIEIPYDEEKMRNG